ncbi:hypothetical protein Tco_1278621 [Tanacetum coccineum]
MDGICARPPYYVKNFFMNYHLLGEWEIARDVELNPFKDVLVFRKMVDFLGAIPINLKGNMWESGDLIEKKIDWNKPPKKKTHFDIDANEDITLDSTHFDNDLDMFGVYDLHGDEVFVETQEPVVNATTTTSTILVSTATATTTTITTTPVASKPSQNKGKAKMTEFEKPLKKKDQIMYDQEVA